MNRARFYSENNMDHIVFDHDIQPTTFIEEECTLVWRFPLDISQSSIGGRTTLSNACTLIALKTAELIIIHNIDMPKPRLKAIATNRVMGGADMTERRQSICSTIENKSNRKKFCEPEYMKCPSRIMSCLINGIIDGNEAYLKDAGEGSTRNYNLPDAIKACEFSFSEVDFKLTTGSIKDALPKLMKLAVRHSLFQSERRLVFVLISCVRTVLIIFDRLQNSLTLFDAHHHIWPDRRKIRKHGALIASCHYSNLNLFAQWIQNFVFPDIRNTEKAFEISLIQISEIGTRKAQTSCKYPLKWPKSFRTPVFHAADSQENKENCRPESVRLSSSPKHSLETSKTDVKGWNKAASRFYKWRKRLFSRKSKKEKGITNKNE